MRIVHRAIQILTNEGIWPLFISSFNYLYNRLRKYYEYIISIAVLRFEGRRLADVRWLIEESRDRNDALIGSENLAINYPSERARARHYYRYTLVAMKMSDYKKQYRILDVASGTGYGSAVINKKHSDIDYNSCDISRDACRYGSEYYPSAEYVVGDNSQLPYKDSCFNCIVSFETMEHVPDLNSYLRELKRCSNNRARIFLSVPFDEKITDAKEDSRSYPHLHTFDFKKLDSLLSTHFPDKDISYYAQRPPDQVISPSSLQSISQLPDGIEKIESPTEYEKDIKTIIILAS